MANYSDSLWPPSIAGTLPSFYTESGTTILAVPFSMNSAVSRAAVAGFNLRLKTTTTDTLVGMQSTPNCDWENMVVNFTLSSDIVKRLIPGDFYKVQLAYYSMINGTQVNGYYSTAAVIKYTEEPSVIIQGLAQGELNSINTRQFYGQYHNTDISEKVYQYRFLITSIYRDPTTGASASDVFLDTGWLIHDSSEDVALDTSTDLLVIDTSLQTTVNYEIRYSIITNNGLQVNSTLYRIISVTNMGDILPLTIHASLDYENARMKITCSPFSSITQTASANFNGNYYILRTDTHSNLKSWLNIYSFQSFGPVENFVFYDYTIESGVAYKYAIQRINSANILSQRVETSQSIASYFEDCFLYDGKRQLKIRLNANVSSIKEVISETKKTTLGSKYPFIFRNGALNYKEFPITGILTYLSDNEELFLAKSELLHSELLKIRARNARNPSKTEIAVGKNIDDTSFIATTDQDDENIAAEKTFALTALAWLNDGNIKLFKSSQEGNFIVKLLNTSLSPLQNTNRMIHTFTCTANEVQPYTADALFKYEILSTGTADIDGHTWEYKTAIVRIIDRRELWMDTYGNATSEAFARFVNAFTSDDLTGGDAVTKVVITDGHHGDLFQWGDFIFALDPTGSYVVERDVPYIGPLTVLSSTENHADLQSRVGVVTLTKYIDTAVKAEAVNSQRVLSYFGWSGYGNELELDSNGQSKRNILQDFAGNKYLVSNSYRQVVHSFPEYAEADLYANWSTKSNNDKKKLALLFGDYGVFLDSTTGIYYKCNPSNYNLTTFIPDKRIRTKGASSRLTDITDYGSAGTDIIEIDYSKPAEVYWTVGNDVFVNFFLQVQQMFYGIESDDREIATAKEQADSAKEQWLALTFNFEKITSKPTNQNTIVLVYMGEHFTPINLKDWDSYVNYNKYTVKASGFNSKTIITNAYNEYRNREETLEAKIEAKLNRG